MKNQSVCSWTCSQKKQITGAVQFVAGCRFAANKQCCPAGQRSSAWARQHIGAKGIFCTCFAIHGTSCCARLLAQVPLLHCSTLPVVMQYIDHPAHFCYPIPSNLSHEEGAMAEPLSVGVHACRRAGVSPGKNVAIIGAGPIGEHKCLLAQSLQLCLRSSAVPLHTMKQRALACFSLLTLQHTDVHNVFMMALAQARKVWRNTTPASLLWLSA